MILLQAPASLLHLILCSPLLRIAEGLLWTTLKSHLIRAFIRLVVELLSRPGKKQLIIASDSRAPFEKVGGPSGSHTSLT